ncbi:hypothetical protein F2Q69_00022481 [Brassica cretica]|uniref:Uncharacterized protein n=1 Tax=Brassica cretica TaxID=69181 RepID=A0A8S9Q3N0_BRACR|nr:hypothetical protein F2Q69_00022481 [Brassica cretica]
MKRLAALIASAGCAFMGLCNFALSREYEDIGGDDESTSRTHHHDDTDNDAVESLGDADDWDHILDLDTITSPSGLFARRSYSAGTNFLMTIISATWRSTTASTSVKNGLRFGTGEQSYYVS